MLLAMALNVSAKPVDSIPIKHVDSLLELSRLASVDMDTYKSVEYAVDALRNSRAIDYQFGLLRSNHYIGQMLFYNGNFDESLKYLADGESLEIAKDNPQILSQILKVKGQIYYSLELIDNSVKEYRKAAKYAGKIQPKSASDYVLSQIYENIHHVFVKTNQPDSVYHYLNKSKLSLELLDEARVFPHLVNNYTSLGYYYYNLYQFENAEKYYNMALDIAHKYNYTYVSRTHMYLGDVFHNMQQEDKALHHYGLSLANLQQRRIENEIPALYSRFERSYMNIGNDDSVAYYQNKRVQIENKLANTKVSAAKDVLNILLNEHIDDNKGDSEITSILYVAIALVFILGIVLATRYFKNEGETKSYDNASGIEMHNDEAIARLREAALRNEKTFMKDFAEAFPKLCNNLKRQFPDISSSDFHLCALTFLKFNTQEIADCSFVTTRSVQTRRSRLRKKINLNSEIDLYHYLYKINSDN